jgi:hypothetical protein
MKWILLVAATALFITSALADDNIDRILRIGFGWAVFGMSGIVNAIESKKQTK